MNRETEDQIMGWYIIMMIALFITAILNATPTPETTKPSCTEEVQ